MHIKNNKLGSQQNQKFEIVMFIHKIESIQKEIHKNIQTVILISQNIKSVNKMQYFITYIALYVCL